MALKFVPPLMRRPWGSQASQPEEVKALQAMADAAAAGAGASAPPAPLALAAPEVPPWAAEELKEALSVALRRGDAGPEEDQVTDLVALLARAGVATTKQLITLMRFSSAEDVVADLRRSSGGNFLPLELAELGSALTLIRPQCAGSACQPAVAGGSVDHQSGPTDIYGFIQSLTNKDIPSLNAGVAAASSREQRAAYAKWIEAAAYGEPTHLAYPDTDVFKGVAASAKVGCITAGDKISWERIRKAEHPFAQLLLDMFPTWHALVWQWAVSPATVLNEIFQYASLVTSSGEALAVCYAELFRKKVEKLSQRKPFNEEGNHEGLEEMFFEVHEAALREARDRTSSGAVRKQSLAQSEVPCLHHQLGTCSFKQRCDKAHVCPFCGSAKQGCLRDHLAALAKPKMIVNKDGSGGGKGSDGKHDRPYDRRQFSPKRGGDHRGWSSAAARPQHFGAGERRRSRSRG